MKKLHCLTVCILLLSLLFTILAGCSTANISKLKIVTSTSLLAYIAQQVGGDRVDVMNLIPATQHPGDFNVKPSDIEKLASANLFLLMGAPGEVWADKLITSANNPNLTVVKANIISANLTPSLQLAATDKVLSALNQVDSKNTSAYQKSGDEYKQRISAKETEIKAKLAKANASQTNAIASAMQADFLKWAGINVVAVYSDPKSLTPQIVKGLVDQGKTAKVTLIVDNVHNGKDAGKAIAEELGAKQINLSNFPGGLDNTETWEKAIDRNVELILGAIAR
jgi:zinc transport system substrate-binding protein